MKIDKLKNRRLALLRYLCHYFDLRCSQIFHELFTPVTVTDTRAKLMDTGVFLVVYYTDDFFLYMTLNFTLNHSG